MSSEPTYICLSHLRWNFVYQRPNHLMSRCAQTHAVFFVEEPMTGGTVPRLEFEKLSPLLTRVVPYLPEELPRPERNNVLTGLIDQLIESNQITDYVLWYYTPMALDFTRHLSPITIVYDCMDELSGFKDAPHTLPTLEAELLKKANVVFAGGYSLYQSKRLLHPNVYLFPNSVDLAHFERALEPSADTIEPSDQEGIPYPRIGYYGAIDERLDLALIAKVADARPDWHLVMVGPIVKIDPSTVPLRPNIHYLGMKIYEQLPDYLAGWDVAIMPFAQNEATRFISPAKTLEYLAARKPIVSTPIADIIHPYGKYGLVRIAETAEEFISEIDALLEHEGKMTADPISSVLGGTSWDQTWTRMEDAITIRLSEEPTIDADFPYPAYSSPEVNANEGTSSSNGNP